MRVVLFALLAIGCSDQTLGKFNSRPSASILSHQDGDRAKAGAELVAVGLVEDPDGAPSDLLVTWRAGDETVFEGMPAEDGETSCSFLVSGESLALFLEARDPEGAAGSDRVDLSIEPMDSPVVEILSPENGDHGYAGGPVELLARIEDADDTPAHLVYSWLSDVQGALIEASVPLTDGTTQDVVFLEEGQHRLTLVATDDDGNEGRASVGLGIQPENRPPTCSITSPAKGAVAASGSLVSLTGRAGDPDQAVRDLLVTWSSDLDGVLAEGNPDSSGQFTFETNDLSVGAHRIEFVVTDELGETCSTRQRLYIDGLPGAPVVEISPDPASSSDDLVATIRRESLDPDGDEVTYRYAWYRDGIATGETSARLRASETARGELWRVVVSPFDGLAEGEAGWDEIVLGNSPPSLSAVSIGPAGATAADPLVCAWSGFSDPDGDPDLSTAVWSIGGVTVGSGTRLSSGYARGNLVVCTVTPFDGYASGSPLSAALTIANQRPEVTALAISPTHPDTEDTLTALVTSRDGDGDAITLAYAWTVNGALAGTSSTLSGLTAFGKLDVVSVSVSPFDGTEWGDTVSSASVIVVNSPPTAPVVAIEPSDPVEMEDDLVCVVRTPSTDADGDPISYGMSWRVDGAAYGSGSGDAGPLTSFWPNDTVPAEDTMAGQTWTCTAWAGDGSETSPTATASATIVSADVDWSGTWDLGTTISYRCAYGLVNFNFTTVRLTDAYPTLVVVASGNVGTMSGSFSSATEFSVTNVLAGGCTETYTMTGTFTGEDSFTGRLTAGFSGMCLDCSGRSWTFAATR